MKKYLFLMVLVCGLTTSSQVTAGSWWQRIHDWWYGPSASTEQVMVEEIKKVPTDVAKKGAVGVAETIKPAGGQKVVTQPSRRATQPTQSVQECDEACIKGYVDLLMRGSSSFLDNAPRGSLASYIREQAMQAAADFGVNMSGLLANAYPSDSAAMHAQLIEDIHALQKEMQPVSNVAVQEVFVQELSGPKVAKGLKATLKRSFIQKAIKNPTGSLYKSWWEKFSKKPIEAKIDIFANYSTEIPQYRGTNIASLREYKLFDKSWKLPSDLEFSDTSLSLDALGHDVLNALATNQLTSEAVAKIGQDSFRTYIEKTLFPTLLSDGVAQLGGGDRVQRAVQDVMKDSFTQKSTDELIEYYNGTKKILANEVITEFFKHSDVWNGVDFAGQSQRDFIQEFLKIDRIRSVVQDAAGKAGFTAREMTAFLSAIKSPQVLDITSESLLNVFVKNKLDNLSDGWWYRFTQLDGPTQRELLAYGLDKNINELTVGDVARVSAKFNALVQKFDQLKDVLLSDMSDADVQALTKGELTKELVEKYITENSFDQLISSMETEFAQKYVDLLGESIRMPEFKNLDEKVAWFNQGADAQGNIVLKKALDEKIASPKDSWWNEKFNAMTPEKRYELFKAYFGNQPEVTFADIKKFYGPSWKFPKELTSYLEKSTIKFTINDQSAFNDVCDATAQGFMDSDFIGDKSLISKDLFVDFWRENTGKEMVDMIVDQLWQGPGGSLSDENLASRDISSEYKRLRSFLDKGDFKKSFTQIIDGFVRKGSGIQPLVDWYNALMRAPSFEGLRRSFGKMGINDPFTVVSVIVSDQSAFNTLSKADRAELLTISALHDAKADIARLANILRISQDELLQDLSLPKDSEEKTSIWLLRNFLSKKDATLNDPWWETFKTFNLDTKKLIFEEYKGTGKNTFGRYTLKDWVAFDKTFPTIWNEFLTELPDISLSMMPDEDFEAMVNGQITSDLSRKLKIAPEVIQDYFISEISDMIKAAGTSEGTFNLNSTTATRDIERMLTSKYPGIDREEWQEYFSKGNAIGQLIDSIKQDLEFANKIKILQDRVFERNPRNVVEYKKYLVDVAQENGDRLDKGALERHIQVISTLELRPNDFGRDRIATSLDTRERDVFEQAQKERDLAKRRNLREREIRDHLAKRAVEKREAERGK